ncbi:UPF0280 family protein [Enterovirga aerilata]|uniref:UPF0280 family protein n=1 Tax=Enterovirga aerilata TaxID=2730920 RepID=A0A849I4D0_9HYPH|nr:UPF0280 family protein [Enterovirga sp. DB1703]NNM72191.1 UPF0280 family protein [Enterovirga sp. DB1703]
MRAQSRMLPDGRRLHLQDGPIDLVVEAVGEPDAIRVAYAAAAGRFGPILDELCAELTELRAPFRPGRLFASPIARRMQAAIAPYGPECFITPMAAVAGAVAQEIVDVMVAASPLARASVNNGGDIALHLAPGERVRVGLVDRPDRPSLFGSATILAGHPVRGIATSGWRGRSFSLGIADAVTVLADTAAAADAAATVVANAVDLPGHPAVSRVPACDVQCDSDLGERPVTRDVGPLAEAEIDEALSRGLVCAERLVARGLIRAAALHLQGETRVAGAYPPPCGEGRVAPQARTGVGVETNVSRPSHPTLFHPHPARAGARVRPPRKGEGRRELVP